MESPGVYPVKSKTHVADVARYQNDGTGTITPSRFIERAAESADHWEKEISDAVEMYLDGHENALGHVSGKIAGDISRMIDRIKTGRLKRSPIGVVTHGRS